MSELIERQAVLDIVDGYSESQSNVEDVTQDIISDIVALPSVNPQPKTGHWIKVTNGRGGHKCDVCNDYAPSFQNGDEYLSAFCPDCGAKMEVRDGHENGL